MTQPDIAAEDLFSGHTVPSAALVRHLQDLGYTLVGKEGKARTWKHELCARLLTYREEPTGEICWSDEITKIRQHIMKVQGLRERAES